MIKTPFRFPGSKNKLLSIISSYLFPLVESKEIFLDVFVGGGSVLLHVAENFPYLKHLFANDKDPFVANFWKVVSDSNRVESLKLMLKVEPTIDLYYKLRESQPEDEIESAYRAIFFNRTSFSGDMRRGASPIGGRKQSSVYKIGCRYNYNALIKKIDQCHNLLHDRLIVENLPVSDIVLMESKNTAVYLDPPYYVKGKMLYEMSMKKEEHEALAERLRKLDNWVLSYDNCKEITDLYSWSDIEPLDVRYCIQGKKTSWNETKEILIIPRGTKQIATKQETQV